MSRGEDRDAVLMARYGWRRSVAPICPRVVAGKRCRVWKGDCVCQRYYSRLLDHGAMWLDGRAHVLTGEPYDFNPEDLARFLAETAEEGLRLVAEVAPESAWYPGHTTLVIVRRARQEG